MPTKKLHGSNATRAIDTSVYVNQLHTGRYGVEKNKRFLALLYNSDRISGISRFFDKLDGYAIRRERDPDMTVGKFTTLITEDSIINLQVGSPDPHRIRYVVRLSDPQNQIIKFLFVDFPYTEGNFAAVSKLYSEAFGRQLDKEPYAEGLLDYYRLRIRLGY